MAQIEQRLSTKVQKDTGMCEVLIRFFQGSKFNRIVKKYDGDKYVKSFTCWNRLLVMMFAQLTKQDSLRTLSTLKSATIIQYTIKGRFMSR